MVRKKTSPEKSSASDANKSNESPSKSNMVRRKQQITIRMKNTGDQMVMRKALYKEIKYLQSHTNLLIPKLSFSRVIREIMQEVGVQPDLRIQMEALKALQEACELYMVQFFEDAYCCTLHAKRKTLMLRDMQLARRAKPYCTDKPEVGRRTLGTSGENGSSNGTSST